MNIQTSSIKNLVVVTIVSLLLTACSSSPTKPDGAVTVRNKLTQLQSDSQLASRAPVEIKDAEVAVRAAEQPQKDEELANHLVVMADRKVEIARARAQSRLFEDQRKQLSEQSEKARLDARTREADLARNDANMARRDAETARTEAERARMDQAMAQDEADIARMETEEARRLADEYQQQVIALNARATERGLIVTLGDVLFETGKSDLKGGSISNLDKLAFFLDKYPDRTIMIEGHTDNVGDENYNYTLSQRRAESVKSYLVSQGLDPTRVSISGLGEGSPVADNSSDTGRQQNRRVEVIISNTNVSSR